MIADRLAKLRREIVKREVDGMLVSQPENMLYLSGFDGGEGFLLITAKDTVLATDFRYTEQAKQQSPGFALFEIKGKRQDWFLKLMDTADMRRLGFEAGHLTFAACREFTDILDKGRPRLRLVPLEKMVESLRSIKEPEEIAAIREAAVLADSAIDSLTAKLKPGVTEQDLAWRLERHMREAGSEAMPFEVIVAAGPNGAMAHHRPSTRPIDAGEPVIIDMGARVRHYCSDLTRTIYPGKADDRYRKIYGIVLKAQEAAIGGIRAGMTGVQADNLARSVIKAAGYAEMFGHGTGHGVGLNVHDNSPSLSPLAPPDPLADGMVFSIEPGIYVPGWGGVRIEDLAVMENGRVRLLSRAGKWRDK